MKQTRIVRPVRTSRRPEPALPSDVPTSPASSTAAAGTTLTRIDRVLNGR